MSEFLQSISGILTILFMIAVGYILAKFKWFDESSTDLLVKLVVNIALPAYMISTITKDFTATKLLHTLPDLRFPIISMVILYGISIALVHIIRIKKEHQGLFESMFLNSNTVFIGLPINMALFGEKSLPYVLVYYMANTAFFWTIGVYLIQKDSQYKEPFSIIKTLKKIFSPPLLGFIVGVIIVALDVKLPDFLMSDFTYIGDLTIPLSMIFIGIAISKVKIRQIKLNRANLGILFGRFIMAPIVMTLLVIHTDLPILMKQVFIIQSAMPVMTNAPIIARKYDADYEYASVMVTETTILSLFVVPVLILLVQQIN